MGLSCAGPVCRLDQVMHPASACLDQVPYSHGWPYMSGIGPMLPLPNPMHQEQSRCNRSGPWVPRLGPSPTAPALSTRIGCCTPRSGPILPFWPCPPILAHRATHSNLQGSLQLWKFGSRPLPLTTRFLDLCEALKVRWHWPSSLDSSTYFCTAVWDV